MAGAGRPARAAGDNDHDIDNMPGGPQDCGQQQGGQTFSAWIDAGR